PESGDRNARSTALPPFSGPSSSTATGPSGQWHPAWPPCREQSSRNLRLACNSPPLLQAKGEQTESFQSKLRGDQVSFWPLLLFREADCKPRGSCRYQKS